MISINSHSVYHFGYPDSRWVEPFEEATLRHFVRALHDQRAPDPHVANPALDTDGDFMHVLYTLW